MTKRTHDVWDRPIDFWLHGPIRQIMEQEFETALLEYLQHSSTKISIQEEFALHNRVIADAFTFLIDTMQWSEVEERNRAFTRQNHCMLQQELNRLLQLHLDASEGSPQFAEGLFLQPALGLFRFLPRRIRKFFSP